MDHLYTCCRYRGSRLYQIFRLGFTQRHNIWYQVLRVVGSILAVFSLNSHCSWRRVDTVPLHEPGRPQIYSGIPRRGVAPELIIASECLHGEEALHCQDTTPVFDTIARAEATRDRIDGFGRASAG